MSGSPDRRNGAPSSFVDVVRRHAAAQGDAPAFTFLLDGEVESERLSYAELDRRAAAVAARLQELDMAGERALLLFPPGLDFVAAFLGCLYAGVVAVPAYPPRPRRRPDRLRAILDDARPRAVLTSSVLQARVRAVLAGLDVPVPDVCVAVDEVASDLAGRWRQPAMASDSLAFLQYTSGSTSTPKGVAVSHGNLLANERWIAEAFAQSEASVIVGWLPLYHDMGLIGNVLQPLYVGARCLLMSPAAFLQRPARWLEAISRYRATTSGGPNFAYDLCVRRVSPEQRATLDLASWRVAFNGAEPVRAEVLERFATAFAGCGFRRASFLPCYGLAEATLLVAGGAPDGEPTVRTFDRTALEAGRTVPAEGAPGRALVACGRPPRGAEVRIVDAVTLLACPPDRVGEIWVAGPAVAGGYWNRPAETAASFGARLAEPAGGAYLRTGDLGFLADGELFVTGRLKDLIILRGRNHYPQDIEATAERSHAALRPAGGAAFAVDLGGEERLVVIQELERGQEAESAVAAVAIRRAVAEEHEVGVHEVVLLAAGTLLKTSSGKVERRACRAAYLAGDLAALGRSREEPEPETLEAPLEPPEDALPRGAEGEVLRAAGAADRRRLLTGYLMRRLHLAEDEPAGEPFSRLALDSLQAIVIQNAIEGELGVRLGVATLLEAESLDAAVDEILRRFAGEPPPAHEPPHELAGESVDAPAGDEAGDGEVLAASYGQRALWFLEQLAPGSGAYTIAAAMRVRPAPHPGVLARALAALGERHAALRTTFAAGPHGPRQRIRPQAAPALCEEDGRELDEDRLRQRLLAEASRPFDLERGPLLRLLVLSRPGGEAVLLLTVHHLVADFWSLTILARELGRLYSQGMGGPAAELPRLPRDYGDYVRWQQRLLASDEGERLWAFWREELAGSLQDLDLPVDRQRSPAASRRGGKVTVRWENGLAAGLRALGAAQRATLYVTVLAGFTALLARHSGQTDFLVGSPATGRSGAEWAGVVGYFVNPLPLRADLGGDPTFVELLGRMKRRSLAAVRHQDLPFAVLVEKLRPGRDVARFPLFQAMLVWQRAQVADLEGLVALALGEAGADVALGDLILSPLALSLPVAQLDLSLAAAELADGLTMALQYSTELFDGVTMDRLLGHLRTLLSAALADPGCRLAELPLLSSAERQQLAVEWNATAVDWPEETIHGLFAAQAARTPESVAVVCGEHRLCYAELDRLSEGLAVRLRRQGVGPEVRVGVLLPRRCELLWSLLGVLKAGGAYVALDPEYPSQRLVWMLADARAAVLVTTAELSGLVTALESARPGRKLPRLLVEEFVAGPEPAAEAERAAGPAAEASSGNLAYLIYTSGSTGRPKGIAVEHRNASALLHWSREQFSAVGAGGRLRLDVGGFRRLVVRAVGAAGLGRHAAVGRGRSGSGLAAVARGGAAGLHGAVGDGGAGARGVAVVGGYGGVRG